MDGGRLEYAALIEAVASTLPGPNRLPLGSEPSGKVTGLPAAKKLFALEVLHGPFELQQKIEAERNASVEILRVGGTQRDGRFDHGSRNPTTTLLAAKPVSFVKPTTFGKRSATI